MFLYLLRILREKNKFPGTFVSPSDKSFAICFDTLVTLSNLYFKVLKLLWNIRNTL